MALQNRDKRPNRRKPANPHRNRGYAIEEFGRLTPALFKLMFRVTRDMFDEILAKIEPQIKRDATYAINSSGHPIATTTRLAVTLRWLAGGSYLDLCFAWGISKSSFFSESGVLWPTIDAIDKAYEIGLPIDDPAAMEEIASGFREHSNEVFDHLVLAIDGLSVRTRCPYPWESTNIKDYRSRKGGFAFVILAGCDIRAKFHFATAKHAGSTNDIIAWNDSDLCDALRQGLLPKKYFFVGDDAFLCTDQFLTPWPGRGLGPWKDSFNYWLSHSRQSIERAFGMLTQRWGIFWRIFKFSLDRWAMVSQVCMKLHNICVDNNIPLPPGRFAEDIRRGDEWVVDTNDQEDDDFVRADHGRATGDRRRNITEDLERKGMKRPPHARSNSRA